MAVRTDEGSEGDIIVEEVVENTFMAARATGWLTQEYLTGYSTLFDSRNGFNELIRLEMFWSVHHQLLEKEPFDFH